jgi:hypothetical protein
VQFSVVRAYFWQREADAGVSGPANVNLALMQVHNAIATVPEVDDQPR